MFDYFRKRKLRKAFSTYVHVLGPELSKRYGSKDQYTVMQIQAAAESLDIDCRFIACAVALFRREESENTINLLGVDQEFINSLRQEIADSLFGGNTRYRTTDVVDLSKKAGWHGGPPPNWMENKRGRTSL